MKALILVTALALSGCQTLTPVVTEPTAIENQVVLPATDALSRAADAYAGVATGVTAAVNAGFFNDDQLRSIRMLNNHIKNLLEGTDTSLTVAQRSAGVFTAIAQLKSIIGSK